jgi:cell division protein FtsB
MSKVPLSQRIRPNSEASPWVVEEVRELEAEIDRLRKEIKKLREHITRLKAGDKALRW